MDRQIGQSMGERYLDRKLDASNDRYIDWLLDK